MKQELPTGVVIAIIAAMVLIAAFFLYRTWTGGAQGEGRPGEVQAAPPVPGGGAPPNAPPAASPSGY
ncbi:MAG: hypothetical protein NZ556_06985 [Fimbriimonadales bacterium]|nr:hypothetical protein [Fimbriimonadales bacterium]